MTFTKEEMFQMRLELYRTSSFRCDSCTQDGFWTGEPCPIREKLAELESYEFKDAIANCSHYVSDSKYPERIHSEYLMFPNDWFGHEVYEKVVKFLKDNIEFQEEIHYLVCASWILLTYTPELWSTYPLLHFTGLSGSGKSRAWNTISKIAYNPKTYTNPTPAVVLRTIKKPIYSEEVNDTKGKIPKKKEVIAIEFNTLFIDEFLKVNKFTTPQEEEIVRILNDGYKINGTVPRCIGENFEVKEYVVAGFKCISCIQSIPETLSNRCITIPMVRSNRRFNLRIDIDEIKQLQEDLNNWRNATLNNFELIDFIEQNTAEKIIFKFTKHDNRLLELYYPIYRITPSKFKSYILKYVKQIALEKREEYYNTFDAEVFEALLNVYNPFVGWISTDDVTKEYNKSHLINPLDNRVIGRALKTMGFKNKKTNTQRGYEINPILLSKLAKRFGMEDRIQQK